MIIIGLTGSIGMGKSTVAAMFRGLRVPVFDADAEIHRLQRPGSPALAAIESAFPGTTPGEKLDRSALASRVFKNPDALARLERIMHPLVADARSDFLRRHRLKPAVVLDIPLLFERGAWQDCHLTVVVSAPYRVQRARVLARPGMTKQRFQAIVSAQMPDRRKRQRANYVIETGRGRRATLNAVRKLVSDLSRASFSFQDR